jgi:hypothetical protein
LSKTDEEGQQRNPTEKDYDSAQLDDKPPVSETEDVVFCLDDPD